MPLLSSMSAKSDMRVRRLVITLAVFGLLLSGSMLWSSTTPQASTQDVSTPDLLGLYATLNAQATH